MFLAILLVKVLCIRAHLILLNLLAAILIPIPVPQIKIPNDLLFIFLNRLLYLNIKKNNIPPRRIEPRPFG